ncbi:type II toxin-antitoxin system VapB family antitoxin [Laspinema olomoucense]|uniref:DUF2281 domain-containing protein n=1 Tax=Laspinema olomoucense D3b TaxID=2953688 RepID=A0ABT2N3W9_9CYAN|nr:MULTISPECIES: DUF2281 domain-containing protein [unclassified Laspinema]MCT7977381.1 DUF2281 domain-containing protein [Laspinema sp. D3b]MCT7986800.1 DUF2281 domain-containing protein [Laspinema sp. D3a]
MSTSTTESLIESAIAQLEQLPPQQQQQVLDYIEFLAQKYIQPQTPQPRVSGLHRGKVWMSEDFNDPIPSDYWSDTKSR